MNLVKIIFELADGTGIRVVANWASFKKSDLKIDVIKNVTKKKCAPKFVFFNNNKLRKIRMILILISLI